MHRPEINLFRHPTTTVYVDDSSAFLYSISLGVDHQPFRTFSDPFAGLDYIEQFSQSYDENPQSDANQSSDGRLGYILRNLAVQKLQDQQRFAEPSVLVVDYSMPQLNGLDLCSRITNPYVKKVLLTGVAEEKIAIKALNTELIDFYISKSESSLSQELTRIISHLRERYFQNIYGWTRDIYLRHQFPYLYDSQFADYFEDVMERLNIVEYYPIDDPWGFLLVDADGKKFAMEIREIESKSEPKTKSKSKKKSAADALEPQVVKLHAANKSYHCAILANAVAFENLTVKPFSHYQEGPGLNIITTRFSRDPKNHEN